MIINFLQSYVNRNFQYHKPEAISNLPLQIFGGQEFFLILILKDDDKRSVDLLRSNSSELLASSGVNDMAVVLKWENPSCNKKQ